MKIKCIGKLQLLKALPKLSAALSGVSNHGLLPLESVTLQSGFAIVKISAGFSKTQKITINEQLYNTLLEYDVENLAEVYYKIDSNEILDATSSGWNEKGLNRDRS